MESEKYSRGKNPNSRRTKPERKLVKITRNVYADQAHITGAQMRTLIDQFSQTKTGIQSDPAEK